MELIVVYIILVAIGDGVAYLIGRAVDVAYPGASLPVFLGIFFFVFWAAWELAIRFTGGRPKAQ